MTKNNNNLLENAEGKGVELKTKNLITLKVKYSTDEESLKYIYYVQEKTVVLPKLETVKKSITQSLEELGIDVLEFNDWKELWSVVKKSKVKYRFPLLSKYESSPFSKNHKRGYLTIYEF